jgi:hypothetical protein
MHNHHAPRACLCLPPLPPPRPTHTRTTPPPPTPCCTQLSRVLRDHARTIPGKAQLFINAYAKALEVGVEGCVCVVVCVWGGGGGTRAVSCCAVWRAAPLPLHLSTQ